MALMPWDNPSLSQAQREREYSKYLDQQYGNTWNLGPFQGRKPSAGPRPSGKSNLASANRYQAQADAYKSGTSKGSSSKGGKSKTGPATKKGNDAWSARLTAQAGGKGKSSGGKGGHSHSHGGGGGGRGGGGGGGGSVGRIDSYSAQMNAAKAAAAADKAALDAKYKRDKAELRELYNFAETAQEKAKLANILKDLERQRSQGVKAIDAGYTQARKGIEANAKASRETAKVEGQEMGDVYRQAAEAIAASNAQLVAEDVDTGLGAAVGGAGEEAGSIADLTAAAAPREQALQQRLGNIVAEDQQWLADSLSGEQQAKGADLNRLAMAYRAESQNEHSAAVNDRIARERMAWAQQVGALQGDYRSRGWDLEDQQRDIMMRLAEMNQRAAEAAAARAAAAAASRRRYSGGGGSGGSSSGGPNTIAYNPSQVKKASETTVNNVANAINTGRSLGTMAGLPFGAQGGLGSLGTALGALYGIYKSVPK